MTCLFATISFLHFSSLQAKIHSVERITIKLVHKRFRTKIEIPKKDYHLSYLSLFNVSLASHSKLYWLYRVTRNRWGNPPPPPSNDAAKYHVTIIINSPLTDLHLPWLRSSGDATNTPCYPSSVHSLTSNTSHSLLHTSFMCSTLPSSQRAFNKLRLLISLKFRSSEATNILSQQKMVN